MKLLNWLLLLGRKPKGPPPKVANFNPPPTYARPPMPAGPRARAHGAPLRPSYPPAKPDSYLPPSAPAATKSTESTP